jgi:hypothetical protein
MTIFTALEIRTVRCILIVMIFTAFLVGRIACSGHLKRSSHSELSNPVHIPCLTWDNV